MCCRPPSCTGGVQGLRPFHPCYDAVQWCRAPMSAMCRNARGALCARAGHHANAPLSPFSRAKGLKNRQYQHPWAIVSPNSPGPIHAPLPLPRRVPAKPTTTITSTTVNSHDLKGKLEQLLSARHGAEKVLRCWGSGACAWAQRMCMAVCGSSACVSCVRAQASCEQHQPLPLHMLHCCTLSASLQGLG